jgi:hypothetical protein
MAKEKKSGGQSSLTEGLTDKSPPVNDSSRKPIGSMSHPTVDEGAVRSEVGEAAPPIGPRTA